MPSPAGGLNSPPKKGTPVYQHFVMTHATLAATLAAAPTGINKVGVITIVGFAVSVIIIIAGASIMTRHKTITMGKAGSESGVLGIGMTLIAIGLFISGAIILGLISGAISQTIR